MTKEAKKLSTYQELRKINVTANVEKKNGFNYLSWAWALDQMYDYDPKAKFEFPEREVFQDGTVMIYCEVTIKDITKRGFLPVMDYKNKAMSNPDARAVSDNMMRCLVKTIGLHGLGLGLYAGEDLPSEEKSEPVKKAAPVKKPEATKEQVWIRGAIIELNAIETSEGIAEWFHTTKQPEGISAAQGKYLKDHAVKIEEAIEAKNG